MTPLEEKIIRQIATSGPITIADYMAICLMDPEHGYYTTRDPFGDHGDFTTAPEISQMFGELIGLWMAQCWIMQGRPRSITIAELGPGRGTLMADMLRALRTVPGMMEAAEIHLVEASPTLRTVQMDTIGRMGVTPTWHDAVDTLPDVPLFLVANEFFDALPIRQFLRAEGVLWHERQIGLDGNGSLAIGLSPPAPLDGLQPRIEDTNPGDIVEVCPALPGIISRISGRIERLGGAALIIDYGDWRSLGDTLQAIRSHTPTGILDAPGLSDLTAHVDFEAVAEAAKAIRTTRIAPQGVFLERLGITARAQKLAERMAGPALESHVAAHRRLTHPEEMGSVFKAIALFPSGAADPPGLTT